MTPMTDRQLDSWEETREKGLGRFLVPGVGYSLFLAVVIVILNMLDEFRSYTLAIAVLPFVARLWQWVSRNREYRERRGNSAGPTEPRAF